MIGRGIVTEVGTTKMDVDAGIIDDLVIDVIGTTKVDVGTTVGTILTADLALDIMEADDDGTAALFVRAVVAFEIVDNIVNGGTIDVVFTMADIIVEEGTVVVVDNGIAVAVNDRGIEELVDVDSMVDVVVPLT